MQYCAREYVDVLLSHGIRISMSRTGNPYDNALAESFMRTLKCEEVYLHSYRDRDDALLHIQEVPWTTSTTAEGFTPASGTCRRWLLKLLLTKSKRQFQHEFFEA